MTRLLSAIRPMIQSPAAIEYAAAVSEEYQAMIPLSGLYLLLVADGKDAQLPIFPEGVPAVELTLSDGLLVG